MSKELYIYGGGGHAKVIIEIATLLNYTIKGITADFIHEDFSKYPIIKRDDLLKKCEGKNLFVAIGNNQQREKIFKELEKNGGIFPTLIHPKAIVSSNATLKPGVVIMAGAIINPFTTIQKGSIINTGSVIDHDCIIGDFSHIAPNSSIAGEVEIGKNTFIGVGSTIINNITIDNDITVGAGSVVVRDLKEAKTYKGVPAK